MQGALPSIVLTLALLLVGAVYWRGWVLQRTVPSPRARPREALAFLGGILALWAVLASPLSQLDHHLLSMHMVQHLVLMNVAAPLLLLGAPGEILRVLLPDAVRAAFARSPLRRLLHGLATGLTHPLVTWVCGIGVVLLWHVPAVFAATLHSAGWHALQQGSFLLAGLLFWWPVVLPWPAVARWSPWAVPLYLFLATLPCDALSAFLAFSGRVVYPHYLVAWQGTGLSPLADQECAGALMWFFVTLAYLVPAVAITLRLLAPARGHSAASG